MNKTIIAFLSGIIFSGIFGVPLIYLAFGEYEQENSSKAYYEGRLSVMLALEKEFGSIPYSEKIFEKVIIGSKSKDIISVYENGVKTIKLTGF